MKTGKCKLLKHHEIPMGKSIVDAAKLIKKAKTRHVYVTKRKIPMGVISSIDIVNDVIADGKDPKKTKVEDIMKKPIYACNHDDSIVDCYFKIAKYNVAAIPVLKKDKIIGLLSAQEMMKQFVKKGAKK